MSINARSIILDPTLRGIDRHWDQCCNFDRHWALIQGVLINRELKSATSRLYSSFNTAHCLNEPSLHFICTKSL